jgi:hypothetical protein
MAAARRDLGYRNLSASRPLIEQVVLEQLMLRPGIGFRHGATVESFSYRSDGGVDGVRIRSAGQPERCARCFTRTRNCTPTISLPDN